MLSAPPLWVLGLLAALPAAPALPADLSGEAGLVSDYRYRGVSLSRNDPALQVSLDAELSSGPYAELWMSSIKDEGAGRIEGDLTVGYSIEFSDTVRLDPSVTTYLYPGGPSSNAIEFSLGLEAESGPLTLTLGASLAPPQRGTTDENGSRRSNVYAHLGASYQMGETPFAVRAGLGRETGPWAMIEGPKWDWSAGIESSLDRARFSLDYIGSNAGDEAVVGAIAYRF